MDQFDSPDSILNTVHQIRDSLTTMLASAGIDPTKAREAARTLKIDRNYISPVVKLIRADDLLSVAGDIPISKRIEVLCKSCLNHGASPEDVQAVREAMRNYEIAVKVSSDDRESFAEMLQGMSFDDVTSRQENARKLAFKGNSTVFGVRGKAEFKTAIWHPNAENSQIVDGCRVGGLIQFRRLRPISWPLWRMLSYHDDGEPDAKPIEPLDPDSVGPGELPFVKEFCSEPMPIIKTVDLTHGKRFDIETGKIGNAGSLDIVFGDIARGWGSVYCDKQERDPYFASMFDFQTPTEWAMFDLLVHRELGLPAPPEVLLLDRLNAPRGYDITSVETQQQPFSTQPVLLRPGLVGATVPFFPEYRKLLEYAFAALGQNANDFDGYRVLFKYPTIPSALLMRMPRLIAK